MKEKEDELQFLNLKWGYFISFWFFRTQLGQEYWITEPQMRDSIRCKYDFWDLTRNRTAIQMTFWIFRTTFCNFFIDEHSTHFSSTEFLLISERRISHISSKSSHYSYRSFLYFIENRKSMLLFTLSETSLCATKKTYSMLIRKKQKLSTPRPKHLC